MSPARDAVRAHAERGHERNRLLTELDARTDEEWVAVDEAAAAAGEGQVVVTVPAALLPDVRWLLASHKTG